MSWYVHKCRRNLFCNIPFTVFPPPVKSVTTAEKYPTKYWAAAVFLINTRWTDTAPRSVVASDRGIVAYPGPGNVTRTIISSTTSHPIGDCCRRFLALPHPDVHHIRARALRRRHVRSSSAMTRATVAVSVYGARRRPLFRSSNDDAGGGCGDDQHTTG